MIAVFDSGIGGLSVWRELYKLMPEQDYLYLSDSANCPYGTKPVDFIISRAETITDFFISKGAEVIVIACNTATAAAVEHLRAKYSIPFVGMEPAIKPAAIASKSGVVGVLATANTFKGSLYNTTLEKFASNIKVIERVGEGLVECVESGKFEGDEVETLLHRYIDDMKSECADAIVLGCTHYPFLESAISRIAGEGVTIFNPAPAVAMQTKRVIESIETRKESNSKYCFYSTGDTKIMRSILLQIDPKISDNSIQTVEL